MLGNPADTQCTMLNPQTIYFSVKCKTKKKNLSEFFSLSLKELNNQERNNINTYIKVVIEEMTSGSIKQ